MPKILLKDATAAWKKAKPATMTKTGLSNELRKLEKFDLNENMTKWVPVLEQCKKALEVAAAKDLAKEKQGLECANLLLSEIKFQLNNIPSLRKTVNNLIGKIHETGVKTLQHPVAQQTSALDGLLAAYNKTLTGVPDDNHFHPTNPFYIQVPGRVKLLATAYVSSALKKAPDTEKRKEEMEKYLDANPPKLI
jgi:hypothetical protein